MAITDHNTTKGAFIRGTVPDFIIIPGIEISTDRGHLLGIGIQEPIVSKGIIAAIDEIHDAGGVAAIPHPGRLFSGAIQRYDDLNVNAIEAINGRSFPAQNKKAAFIANGLNLATIGGSDAHFLWEVGSAFTISEAQTTDDLIAAILKKETLADGTASMLRPLRAASVALIRYISDGFAKV